MANPVIERSFSEQATADAALSASQQAAVEQAGPVRANTMSVGGVVSKTLFLLLLVSGGAAWGWSSTNPAEGIPGWYWWVVFGTIFVAIFAAIRPQLALVLGPIYAILQGALIGVISRVYEAAWDGIVINALIATVATVFGMLLLYASGAIKASPRVRKVIVVATLGVALFYLFSFVFSIFGMSLPFIWDGSPLGIALSVIIIIIAALNLVLDFDFIDRGVQAGMPKMFEWLAAFGLMVTIIWLYIEFLRLFARLNQN